ncbi:MAG: 50S ribosomal protein L18, partial [Candidatus Shapirobacteria bacterium]
NQHVWAHIIDDLHGKTLASGNTKVLKTKSTKTEKAYTLGQEIAKMAKTAKVTHVRFDRGLSSYHGRVESFAKGARDGGLKF